MCLGAARKDQTLPERWMRRLLRKRARCEGTHRRQREAGLSPRERKSPSRRRLCCLAESGCYLSCLVGHRECSRSLIFTDAHEYICMDRSVDSGGK